MRKYLFFVFLYSCLITIFCFTKPFINTVEAFALGEKCNPYLDYDTCRSKDFSDEICKKTTCDKSLHQICSKVTEKCIEEQVSLAIKCKCQQDGGNATAIAGANGMVCGDNDPKFDNKGIFYCNSKYACVSATGAQTGTDKVNVGDRASVPDDLKDKIFNDVLCQAPKADGTAICTCAPPTVADHGNFDCYLGGPPPNKAITGHGHCGSSDDVCTNTPGQTYDSGNYEQYTGTLFKEETQGVAGGKNIRQKSLSIQGVSCAKPPPEPVRAVKPPPGPPPPPPCVSMAPDGTCGAFDTALGQLNTNAGAFIASIFGVLLAASGGIALLLIIRAGYILMTSSGNPEKVKAGQEQLVAAIVGLLFIIFSFVILQFIGVDILQIKGFAR